ncbi:MAG: thioredoxin domain-containing protein [Candidatus Aminicenantes bacterium]|nr:thioredoxin domain-containing protein [Candidatus Aminicenantes bacterium]
MNRLAKEKSPYLLQHARNPVDWYPWGEEAFAAARRENKPVFLSIGYSTCHWCHVMERESFADEETARRLNEAFVCVKVDREERPDLDHHYLSVCQALTGSGGWPLTLLLTPDKTPFFASTYIPKENRWGRQGLKELTRRVQDAWKSDPEGIAASAERIREFMARMAAEPAEKAELELDFSEKAYEDLKASFDEDWAGFGPPPKFPLPQHAVFLLRYGRRTGRREAELMAARTLEAMADGGIFDHLGGGFHRYATDREWLVPHFEKMLYDQALLAPAYAEGWLATGQPAFRDTAERVLEYMLRDLKQPGGGFASAEDADSEGEEGKYYLWTEKEIREALEPEEAVAALDRFGVLAEGNFAEPGKARDGRNILHSARGGPRAGSESKKAPEEKDSRLAAVRAKLLAKRRMRRPPFKDTKILTDWNGLAVAALAVCGRAFDRPDFLREAEAAADFLRATIVRPDGGLYHRAKDGEAAIPAFVDDYAFLIWGLIEVYQSTFRTADLAESVRLARRAVEELWDEGQDGFDFAPKDSDAIPGRKKEFADGALPSGNSVMAGNLLYLARLTADPTWEDFYNRLSRTLGARAAAGPLSITHFLSVLELTRRQFHEVVVAGRPGAPDTNAFLNALRREYLPGKVVLLRPEGSEAGPLFKLASSLEPYRSVGGRAAAYVCAGFRCRAPVTSPESLISLLKSGTEDLSIS